MRLVIQRVSNADVKVNNNIIGAIEEGLMVLVGIEEDDLEEDVQWLAKKICGLRIFNDNDGIMNLSINDINGEILTISQFTLCAKTKKGNRPSYIKAAKPEKAEPLFNLFVQLLNKELNKEIQTGVFGADMKVTLTNDGPVTIIMDTKNKE